MALLFPRLARNFIKNGYYPTDSVTMSRVLKALQFSGRQCSILDPCCGEGSALAEVKDHLASISSSKVTAYGVEYDKDRAWHSKKLLDHSIHGDLRNCMIGARQFGLLFLNPPYGDAIADKAQLSNPKAGRLRLEKEFYRRTNGLLQFGGVMVLIIPYYTLDKEFSTWISRHFHDVKVFMAPEQQFQQCVIFGIRHKITDRWATTDEYLKTRTNLYAVGKGDIEADELPEHWIEQSFSGDGGDFYNVPEADQAGKFESVRLDGLQLADSLKSTAGLWKQYDQIFTHQKTWDHKRPLCDVSDWHLALMLAAGQVSGVVESNDGRTMVVRGDTYKDKQVTVTEDVGAKGKSQTVRTHTDIFIPAIRGLDMTPNSKTFGEVFTIK
ncbi:MAG: SAM-dependent methyltransferase [Gammaproteobacteria bacterium]|jgi:hypothetical protein|nr:SAM-dependent methyltransferase [Gammaproteobacteria bacterium]MBT6702245.1 SAM-dependent methyltransferase [Gammaproteobacteria bacterium]